MAEQFSAHPIPTIFKSFSDNSEITKIEVVLVANFVGLQFVLLDSGRHLRLAIGSLGVCVNYLLSIPAETG